MLICTVLSKTEAIVLTSGHLEPAAPPLLGARPDRPAPPLFKKSAIEKLSSEKCRSSPTRKIKDDGAPASRGRAPWLAGASRGPGEAQGRGRSRRGRLCSSGDGGVSGKMNRAKGKVIMPARGATRRGPNSVRSFAGASRSLTEKKRGESLTARRVFSDGAMT
jgi:hypothetical protein